MKSSKEAKIEAKEDFKPLDFEALPETESQFSDIGFKDSKPKTKAKATRSKQS